MKLGIALAAIAVLEAGTAGQEAAAPGAQISWRGRDVAGREIDVAWSTVQPDSSGEAESVERSGQTRDIVVTAGPGAGRGLRIERSSKDGPNAPAVEFFDVDEAAVVHPLHAFGAGPRRGTRLYYRSLIAAGSPLGWARSLPLARGIPLEVQARVAALKDGTRQVEFLRADPLAIDLDRPTRPRLVVQFEWTATVDADGVLIGEEHRCTTRQLPRSGRFAQRNESGCSWRETGVRTWKGESLATLREEAELLRRAFEVLNGDPRTALEWLETFAARPAPHVLDDVAQTLRENATEMLHQLDAQIVCAIDLVWLRGGDPEELRLDRHLGDSALSVTDVRRLFDLGRRLAWVERDDTARLTKLRAIVAPVVARRAFSERDESLVAALLVRGGEWEDGLGEGGGACCLLESEVVERPVQVAPPDTDAVRRRIEELIEEVASG